jgi:hypothetical protein
MLHKKVGPKKKQLKNREGWFVFIIQNMEHSKSLSQSG